MAGSSSRARWIRRAVLALLAATLAWELRRIGPGGLVGADFIEYWSAGRLWLRGADAWDPAALAGIQRGLREAAEPLVMWNPPFLLVWMLPFLLLPFEVAGALWTVVTALLVGGFALGLGRVYGLGDHGGPRAAAVAVAVAFLFAPVLVTLRMGQASVVLLGGAAGFLLLERRGRPAAAGAALALCAAKPHVVHLFLLTALVWAVRGRRWRLLGGGAGLLGASAIVLTLVHPGWAADYLAAAGSPPVHWATPTLGGFLRRALGSGTRWLQYAPALAGVATWLVWTLRGGRIRDWSTAAPPLLLASVLTTPFGWTFDQIVLLPAWFDLAGRARHGGWRARGAGLAALCWSGAMMTAYAVGVPAERLWWAPWLLAAAWAAGAVDPADRAGEERTPGAGVSSARNA